MKENNVISFKKLTKTVDVYPIDRKEENQSNGGTTKRYVVLRTISIGILATLRYTLFLALLWIRTPIRIILSLIASPLVFIIPMIYLGMDPSQKKTIMFTWAVFLGFGTFTLRWFYDVLLIRLSSEPIFLN